MKAYYEHNQQTIYHGDCLEVMRDMHDNSVDTIITDPPYGLAFMGKDWDHGVPGMVFWREALRVAKPGAILMAFGGTRTYHRLACAIEDAGWEVRDCIQYIHDGSQQQQAFLEGLNEDQLEAYLELHYPNMQMEWVYSSGFPKSANISKLMDKRAGVDREVIGVNEDYLKRKPNGMKTNGASSYNWSEVQYETDANITTPTTPQAKLWDGWGSGIAPAHEPIVVAMAPLDGGFVDNAERWGVAGFWIEGNRIGTESTKRHRNGSISPSGWDGAHQKAYITGSTSGRWPKNLIHDGSEEVKRVFGKAGVNKSTGGLTHIRRNDGTLKDAKGMHASGYTIFANGGYGDTGTADRYYKTCPPDQKCILCDLVISQKHSIMNENLGDILCNVNTVPSNLSQITKNNVSVQGVVQLHGHLDNEDKSERLNILANNARKNLKNTLETKESIVQKDVQTMLFVQNAQNAKYAESLCDSCVIAIVQSLVAIQRGNDQESLRCLDSIIGHKKQILIKSLALFVEANQNTDTILTIANLSLLFGYVRSAICDYIISEKNEVNIGLDPTRFLYCSKASPAERNKGLEGMEKTVNHSSYGEFKGTPEHATNNGIPRANSHPTVKPLSLLRYLVRLTKTPTGGIVFDPFLGSGTTLLAAQMEQRSGIGCEINEEYCHIAARRLNQDEVFYIPVPNTNGVEKKKKVRQLGLFDD